jgi:hypothetical protein
LLKDGRRDLVDTPYGCNDQATGGFVCGAGEVIAQNKDLVINTIRSGWAD